MWQWPDMFPRTLNQCGTASMYGIDPNVRQPYTQQWNFTLERELWNMGFRASYVGTKTHQLVMGRNLNQVAAQHHAVQRLTAAVSAVVGCATWAENQGNAFYNGLTLTAERKYQERRPVPDQLHLGEEPDRRPRRLGRRRRTAKRLRPARGVGATTSSPAVTA